MAIYDMTGVITMMEVAVLTEILALKKAPAKELLRQYKELYGEDATGTHRLYLWRKIAYKIQEREHGSLSDKAKGRLK